MGRFVISFAECLAIMPEEFDPYSHWLGILAHERPVDHYRLLGIARFASDPAAITAAADRRMALIRSYQTGPRGRFTQRLLNEIAAAKLCLINGPSKQAYDAMLEGLALATEPPPLPASPAQPTPPALPQWNASEEGEPPLATSHEDEEDAAEARDGEESVGLSAVSAVLALAVVVAVGSYLTWQIVDAGRRSRTIDPQAANGDGQPDEGASEGEGEVPPPDDGLVVVIQETDGSVNFMPSFAVLAGDSLRVETVGITDLLTGWTSLDDAAAWKCKIIKLPTNGVFRVLVTYRAATEADEGSFKLAINGREKTCRVRGSAELVTDEYFLAVTRTGEHSMELRSLELRGGGFELMGIRLVMPTGDE